MTLEQALRLGIEHGASDVHFEAGLPLTMRVRGELVTSGDPVDGGTLLAMARSLLPGERWSEFLAQSSADLSRTVSRVRCRINVLRSARGVGFAIRILSSVQPTLSAFNLHPDLASLVSGSHGLVLVSGATGSGKTSTLAALLQEVNLNYARHIITLESPIEYALTPKKSFIRQREIGRDCPSFRQGLKDAMREDPDVLMVGEMRDPETMQLTLNAAETGHLVLATVHSATCAEALQRLCFAFAPEVQGSVCAQVADSLIAVVAQRLVWNAKAQTLVPELEVLRGTSVAARSVIRQGAFSKLQTVMETGTADGHMTWQHYRSWLDRQPIKPIKSPAAAASSDLAPDDLTPTLTVTPTRSPAPRPAERADENGVLVIDADDADPNAVLDDLLHRR
jgi:twitching motility protein PilT